MFQRVIATAAVMAAFAGVAPVAAQDAQAEALFDALRFADIIDIMREEGVEYGGQIGLDLFPAKVGPSWSATVERIYDADAMQAEVKAAFVASLEGDDVATMATFFDSPLGRKFVDLEVSARRALMDDAVEEASQALAAEARKDGTARFELVDAFVQTNDLIETNIVGALNSNYAFYSGLMAGGAFDDVLTEAQILSDVWDQEPDIRATTSEWVYSFLMLAYDPVTDEELATYTAFSTTPAGKQLNTTLFAAFDGFFDGISRELGYEAARMMTGAEL